MAVSENPEVGQIIRDSAATYKESIDTAVFEAVRQLQRLPCYPDLIDELVERGVRDMVCNARHTVNVAMKREAREYGGAAKVNVGNSRAVASVAESLYDYRIGGAVLGSLGRERLLELAVQSQNAADGHLFNASLCNRLAAMVKDRTVREAVPQNKLRSIFRELQARVSGRAAS